MARIKLDLPDEFQFETEITVRITDINYGGHLGNDAVLSMMHEGRVRFLNHFGYSETNVEGCGIIMADALINYRAEAFYGDSIRMNIAACDFSRHSCDLFYLLTNSATGQEVARAKTTIVFFDYQNRKKMPTPNNLKFREIE